MDIKNTEKYKIAKERYLSGESLTQISKDVKIDRHKLSYLFKEDGIDIRQNGQKHFYDETYFEVIDTEEKAYWLGFLYADGNVSRYGKHEVKVALAYKDLHHVERFANTLLLDKTDSITSTYEAKIKGKKFPSAKVCIDSKVICQQLKKLGCVPNKSLILTFPTEEQVPSYLIRHFVRGYFDGDGSVSTIRNGRCVTINFIGTKSFIESLLEIFHKVCTDYGADTYDQKKNQESWQLQKSKYDTVKEIYEYMYKDATIYLERKYQRFVNLYGKL